MLLALPTISLVLAGALALTNIWLIVRVAQVRSAEKIFVGDGGNERVVRRMRAHANFNENGWVVLGLVVLIELSVGPSPWLWAAAAIFIVVRVLHGLGMDGWQFGRAAGAFGSLLVQLALAGWAIAIPLTHGAPKADAPIEVVPAQG